MAKHLLPASGIRHGNAARTGWDANPYHWTPFDRCFALAPLRSANPCACHVSTETDHHPRRASRRSTCVPHGGTPSLHDPCWTSMSKRSVQDASEPVSARKTAARNRSRRDRSRAFQNQFSESRFANDQNKTPPEWNPRAFAFLGDRGDRSPGGGSVVCAEIFPVVQSCAAEPLRARCRIAPEARGFVRIGDAVGGFHG